MLRQTFLHVPGIGYATDQKLWAQGFLSWDDFLNKSNYCSFPMGMRDTISIHLEEPARALAADYASHFEIGLPPSETWRLYAEFSEKVAFLDIETTGLYPGYDAITVIGLFDGQATRVFIKDINL